MLRPRRPADLALIGGLGLSALGLLDSRCTPGLWLGPLLALVGAWGSAAAYRGWLAGLAGAWALAGLAGPEFRADTGSYFVYLRSLAFDRDLSFANDWAALGQPGAAAARTTTGLVPNSQTLGPAVMWAPFYATAHAYVRLTGAIGLGSWAADGTSEPYRRALALGTVAAVMAGVFLLTRLLSARFGRGPAGLAVAATVLGSPVVYYTLVVPGMAHGLAFALSAALVFALDRTRDPEPPVRDRAWLAVGALLGLLVLVRTQAAVLALVVLPLALRAWRRGQVSFARLAAAGALSVAVFAPQTLAWKALFGSYVTVPQGSRYLDWSSPHLGDVLFSANHGLLPSSPLLALGLLGLVLGLRREPWLFGGGLAAFLALAWTNGAVADWDWEGGDAFGARRFDVAVPFLALGLGTIVVRARDLAARRPLALPAFALGLLVAWNVGFLAVFRSGRYPDAAPLDRVARDQALLLRRVATGVAGAVAGPGGRARAYDLFSGEYLFGGLGSREGALRLAAADERTIGSGFSAPAWRDGGPAFRWAAFPEACLSLPLRGDRRLEALGMLARAPRKTLPQTVTVVVNGTMQGTADLGAEWTALRIPLLPDALRAGENEVCFQFAHGRPSGDDRPAAAVAEVRLARSLDDLAPSPAPAEPETDGPPDP